MAVEKQRIGAMSKKQSTDDYLLSLRKKRKILEEYLDKIQQEKKCEECQNEDCGEKHKEE